MDYSRQSQSLSASVLDTRIGYVEGPGSTTATQSTVLQLGLIKAAASLLNRSVDGLTQSDSAAPAASASIDLSDLTGVAAILVQHHLCESSTLPASTVLTSLNAGGLNSHSDWISQHTSSSVVLNL